MSIVTPRYYWNDTVAENDAVCFMPIPVAKHESLHSVHLTMQAHQLPGSTGYEFCGPYAFLEWNVEAIWVPWSVVLTMTGRRQSVVGGFSVRGGQDDAPGYPREKRDWNRLFRELVFSQGIDGNVFYGANADGTGDTYDPVENVWKKEPYSGTGAEGSDSTTGQAEPYHPLGEFASYGPSGIARYYSSERFLKADSTINTAATSNAITAFFTSLLGGTAIQDVVYRDALNAKIMCNISGPGFLLLGASRYKVAIEAPDFTVSSRDTDEGTHGTEVNLIMNEYMNGDYQRVRQLVTQSTETAGDKIRSIIFGGDNAIAEHAEFGGGISAIFGGVPSRANTISVAGKAMAFKGTPYELFL